MLGIRTYESASGREIGFPPVTLTIFVGSEIIIARKLFSVND